MDTSTIVLLGAIAGFTIFLGLPLARLKNISLTVKGLLTMLATGVLLFLLVDITSKMMEPVGESLIAGLKDSARLAEGIKYAILMTAGLLLGLVGIIYLTKNLHSHKPGPAANPNLSGQPAESSPAPAQEMHPRTLSLIIATGIGAHNLSEGLAIGQAASGGSLQLALILIIGFGLHNMTEGFGIAGPLTDKAVSWKFLGLLGLIGGGPTFLGTIIGISFHSVELFIFCLAFAAGAIIYVIMELLGSSRRIGRLTIVWGLFIGFILGLGTDLILTVAGA